MNFQHNSRRRPLVWAVGFAVASVLLGAWHSAYAADFVIRNLDAGRGEGLSDARRATPIDDNPGTTLGEQRRIALRYAVQIVTSRVESAVPIRIDASVDPNNPELACRRNGATLGVGGATNFTQGFPGAPRDDVVYPLALANALAGRRVADIADLRLFMNGKLDVPANDCLRGARWYYGLRGTPGPNQIDFVASVVHELIHGMGFQSIIVLREQDDTPVGGYPAFSDGRRLPSVFGRYIQDLGATGQPRLSAQSRSQRAEAVNDAPFIVWSSAMTNAATSNFVTQGRQEGRLRIYAPEVIQPASTLSHWSPAVEPDQIMEPFQSVEASVLDGIGLASCVLSDIGWPLSAGVRCPDTQSATIAGPADGDFVTAYATTSVQRRANDGAAPSDTPDDDDDSGGGGGCTLAPGQPFDPIWWVMCVMALGVLIHRRRSRLG